MFLLRYGPLFWVPAPCPPSPEIVHKLSDEGLVKLRSVKELQGACSIHTKFMTKHCLLNKHPRLRNRHCIGATRDLCTADAEKVLQFQGMGTIWSDRIVGMIVAQTYPTASIARSRQESAKAFTDTMDDHAPWFFSGHVTCAAFV